MMRRKVVWGILTIAVAAACAPAHAANHVLVESKSMLTPGASGIEIGVYISNDIDLSGITVPLELRTQEPAKGGGGAFIESGFDFDTSTGHRFPGGGFAQLSTHDVPLAEADTFNCSGPVSSTFSNIEPIGYSSPDAVSYLSVFVNPLMLAGTDGVPGGGTPSLLFVFTVNSVEGCFEIDTCCTTPGNHLDFADNAGAPATPTFEKGIVCIGGNAVHELGNNALPRAFSLGQNYPNPFNAGTVIPFSTEQYGHVRLDVYNILGRRVTTLVDEDMEASQYSVDWDGTDSDGRPVSTGVYFYRIETDINVATRKMLLLK
ncbi:MAG TPA: T9SS type A sorting domain-containing protein [candidate division Zixibacteria bacterium]